MGFFFRKSHSFGPFRFNLSKSGIGVSTGMRGARISMGPRGTYVHAGSNGFYYRKKVDQSSNSGGPAPSQQRQAGVSSHDISPDDFINSSAVSSFGDSSSAELIEQINSNSNEFRFAPVVGIALLISTAGIGLFVSDIIFTLSGNGQTAFKWGFFIAFLLIAGGAYLTWRIHKSDVLKRTTPLFYELENEAAHDFKTIQKANIALSNVTRIWRLEATQFVNDWKRNAGATNLITRTPAELRIKQPPFIATNIEVWNLHFIDQDLYFMPDFILIRQNKLYGAIPYSDLRLSCYPTHFLEEHGVPQDSRIVDYTWRFVNRNGGPDRRFSNNRQIPIVEYGFLHFTTPTGLNLRLHVSSLGYARRFSQLMGQDHETRPEVDPSSPRPRRNIFGSSSQQLDPEVRAAYDLLGVRCHAPITEVVAGYKQMAKMYHPDRLRHLAPEFHELAEERMKDINIAYEVLKRHMATSSG